MDNPLLLPELVELVVQHLWDKQTLQSCALVSRIWVIPCRRALFRNIALYDSYIVPRLLHHLRRYPHLQNSIKWIAIQKPHPSNDYLSALIALFPLIPRLTSLAIAFDRSRSWDAHDQQFIEAFGAFLHTSKCLTGLAVHNLRAETDFQQMFSYLEGTNIKRVSLYTEYQLGDPPRVDFFSSTLSVVHLPAIERLRMGALTFWLRQCSTMFPNLKHLEVVISRPFDLGIWLRDVLQPVALQLESFRLELTHTMFQFDEEELPTNEGLFEGLNVKHFHLCTSSTSEPYGDDEATLINWFTSMFRHLANSGTTVHFVELTFTFAPELDDVEAVSAEWATLDEVLSHSAFRSVQRIHFEEERTLITDSAQPELASVIRRTLPRLASRGVLCFE
ncbi:hypothetical protein BDZ89DRAFT_1073490 [Hymenopellis radicata]|nr:hypothetical protein BDZ89DRAFT_1073490 [Hymenopellis radicata]